MLSVSSRPGCVATALLALIAGAGPAVIAPLAAAELCVVCSAPDVSYRCAFDGADPAGAVPAALQLTCIRELATRGAHKSCSVDRNKATDACPGALVVLARPAPGTPVLPLPLATSTGTPGDASGAQPVTSAAQAAANAAQQTPPADATGADKVQPAADPAPPATVEALAKQTAEQTKKDWARSEAELKDTTAKAGETIGKAGAAVGTAVKKSFDCVASLFQQC